MKPQQQDTEARKESAVYVQTPDGKEIDVPTDHSLSNAAPREEKADQSAENTPTKRSEEVKSGEAG